MIGELAEWSNAAVLKTVDLHGSGGSNPSLSANKSKNGVKFTWTPFFVFVCKAPPQAGRDVRAMRANP